MEYWLIDTESGNSQGCYRSLDEALHAAEAEVEAQTVGSLSDLSLLATRSRGRLPQSERTPELKRLAFVHLKLGFDRA